jgi:hypothetical protein
MDHLTQLAAEHGKNPLDFFWVLERDGSNPHLSFAKQRDVYGAVLAGEGWFAPYAGRAVITLISDNGDIVYDLEGETLLWNPRYARHEIYPYSVSDFLRRAPFLASEILPDDL